MGTAPFILGKIIIIHKICVCELQAGSHTQAVQSLHIE